MSILEDYKPEFAKLIDHLKADLMGLRTGRANPALIENLLVEAYGSKMPIKQVGSITVADARSMTVEPWDKGLLKDVEKAIAAANLGLGTANEGQFIRVSVPQMTEETRRDLVKVLKEKIENGRVAVRGLRDKIRDEASEQEKNNEITEDDKYRLQKDLDELTGKYNDQIKEMLEKKEEEIMTV
ncbi:MAG: ribosome recycling factor [Patescibacteria group bacterium]|jgi:ribosome recycling factor